MPSTKPIVTSSGVALDRRVGGVDEDVLRRLDPRVLEDAALGGAAPEVLVDGVRRALGDVDRQPVLLGEGDGPVTGHAAVTDRGDARKLRGQRADADLEAHLVVALAGAAVRDGVGPMRTRGGHEVLDDERSRQRRDQRVAVHVERVGAYRRADEVAGELLPGIDDDRLDGAAGERALADRFEVLAALPDVDGDGDDLGAGGLARSSRWRRRCRGLLSRPAPRAGPARRVSR